MYKNEVHLLMFVYIWDLLIFFNSTSKCKIEKTVFLSLQVEMKICGKLSMEQYGNYKLHKINNTIFSR